MSFAFSSSSFAEIKRTLDTSTKKIAETMERLSTGLRINDASDDAANLAISETYKSRISAIDATIQNINTAVLTYEKYDVNLASIVSSFESLREIAVNASNGTYSPAELQSFHDQADVILAAVQDIANNANAEVGANNNATITAAGGGAYTYNTSTYIQVGHDATANSRVLIDTLGIGFDTWGGIDLTTQAGAQSAITEIDNMLDTLNNQRTGIGAEISILGDIAEMNANKAVEYSSALSTIRDADIADETAELTRQQIIQESTISIMSQYQDIERSIAYTLLGIY